MHSCGAHINRVMHSSGAHINRVMHSCGAHINRVMHSSNRRLKKSASNCSGGGLYLAHWGNQSYYDFTNLSDSSETDSFLQLRTERKVSVCLLA
jgi:hypothetical protein